MPVVKAQVPVVKTLKITDVEATSFRVLASAEGSDLSERGIAYSLQPGLAKSEFHQSFGNGNFGSYSCGLNKLQPATTYFVRGYAKENGKIYYGNEERVTTLSLTVPAVKTLSVNEIKSSSVRVQGCASGQAIEESGVFVAEKPDQIREGVFYSTGSAGFGSFSVLVKKLKPGTTYYVVFTARNASGSGWGEVLSFKTLD